MPATSGRRATGRKSSGGAKAGSNGVLAGVVVYVDAFLDDRSPMREEYGRVLRNLGADVRARLPAKMTTLTHLVWKHGDEGTAQKAESACVTLVSPSWVHACDKGGVRAPEEDHRADFDPALYGMSAKKKAQRRKQPTLEPTIDEWQGVDNLDLCLSSSQRDPPELSLDADDDDALLSGGSGSSSSSSSSINNNNRGGNRRSAAKAAGKSSSKRAASLGSPAPRGRVSSLRNGGGSRGSSSGSGSNAGVQSGKSRALSGGLSSTKPPSPPFLTSPTAKRKTYGSLKNSRLPTESAAAAGKKKVGFRGEKGAPRGGGGNGLSSGEEGERDGDSYGDGDAATEVEGEAAETGEVEGAATDVDCSRHSLGNSRNSKGRQAAAAAALELNATAADSDDQAEGTELDRTITEDYQPDDTDNGIDRDHRSPAGRTAETTTPATEAAERGAASPLTPAAEAASTWTVGGRGLLGRGSARKTKGLSGLGSAGRVAATGMLKSPSLYVGGGGGSAGGSRLTRGGRGGGGGYGTLSSGGDSTAFDMSDGDGDETERTVLDSTDCESKAARERAGQAEAADHDSSREWSGAEEGPGKAGDSSRKPGGRSSPRGAGNGSGGRGGGTVQQRSSPSPSPRLAAVGGGGGSGGKGITTPMTRASKRAGPGRGAVTANGTMGGAGSASRPRGPAATPGSGYAADRSAGPARTTKARARIRPPASSGSTSAAAGVGTRHGAEQRTAAPEESEGWACGTCTLVNQSKNGKCNACGTARPRRPPRARSAPAALAANGSGGSVSSTPAAAAMKSPPEFTPSGRGEGIEEAQGGSGVASAAADDSPSVPWEGYEMLERSTASSSAKSNRASRPLAPASGRKPRAGNSAGGDGGGGSLPRAASPASGVDLSRASAAKRPRRQHRQQGLRGVLQGGEETGASPLVDGADLSPPGAYLGSSSGAPQSSTGKGSSSSGSNNSSGNDLDGRGSPAAEEEGETVPAVRLFGASAPSPPVAPSPSIVLLGPPPPEEAGAASSRRGTVAGAREGGAGALVDGAGLRNAARGLDDDDDADVDGAGEEVEEDMETEVQGGGMAAGLADGEVCPGKNDSITAEEESETDTVKKSTDGGSSTNGGGIPGDSEATSVNSGGLLDRFVEDGGSGSGSGAAARGDETLVALAVVAEGARGGHTPGPPPSHAAGDAAREAETSDGVQGGKGRASARLKRGATGPAAPKDIREDGGHESGGGHDSSPRLSAGQIGADNARAKDGGVAGVGGTGEAKEGSAVARRGGSRRSTRAAKRSVPDAGKEGSSAAASAAAASATESEAPDPKEPAPAAGRGGRRRSTRGAAAASAAAATAAGLRVPGTRSTARVAAVYAMNKGPAATADSLDEVAAAACVMNLLPGAVVQESQPPPPAERTGPDESDEAAAAMMLIARASREEAAAAAATAAAAAAAADCAAPEPPARKTSGRTRRGAKDSSATAAGSKRGGEGVAARPRRVVGVKRSSREHGDEADSAAGQPGRAPDKATRSSAGSSAKRRKQSSAAEQYVAAGGEGEGAVSGDAGADVAPAGPAFDDNAEPSDQDDMDLFGDDDEGAWPSPCDGDGEPAAASDGGPVDEREQGETGAAAVPAPAAAGKAVTVGASSGKGKARAKRGLSAPKRGGGAGGARAPGGTRSGKGKGKGKAATRTASRGNPRGGGGRGKGGGGGGSAAAAAAGDTGRGQKARGKRKREAGAVSGIGDGEPEEVGEETSVQQGVVRVIFSGLQPGDRQAAMSVVQSLSKSHRPAGSGVCATETEGYTHLVIPDESRRTLKVLFALCAPLAPNGRPPAVVTVSWLYASLEKGFFVDSEAFRPGRYRGRPGLEAAMPPAAETRSISSCLLAGEKVMLAGVSDPAPDVAERLVQATGAQMTRSLEDATLLLVESEPELEAWVQERKALGNSGGSGSRDAGPKNSARHAGEGGGGEIGSGGRSRRLAAGTSSTRKGVAGGGGRSGRSAPGKRRGAVEIAPAWGQENENALEALKSASRVVRLPWLFDSVEKGVRVDIEDFLIRAEGAHPQTTQESVADAVTSQGW